MIENLIRAGALEGLGGARRTLLWELGGLIYSEEGLDITGGTGGAAPFERVLCSSPCKTKPGW